MREAARTEPVNPSSSTRILVCHVGEDQAWADWISEQLSDYEVPRKLVGRTNRRGEGIPGDLKPVAALSVGESGPPPAKELAEAQFLLVICSPSAAASEGLGGCVRTFKSLGKADHTIAVIVEGEPNAGSAAAECFHRALRHEVDAAGRILSQPAEPLAADFRVDGRDPGWFDLESYAEALEQNGHDDAAAEAMVGRQEQRLNLMKLKLAAGILAINLGELTERDKAHQAHLARVRLYRRLGATATLGLLAAAGVFGLLRLRDYQLDADKASKAEAEARGRSSAAERERLLNEEKLSRQAAALRAAEEREKGLACLNGAGGRPPDRAEALRHLALAAQAGDVISRLWRARILVTDKTATDDAALDGVRELAALAAEDHGLESAEAAYALAAIYDAGKILPRDVTKAVAFSEKAAMTNHAASMEQLAYMLERGLGGPARRAECLSWYEKSAGAGSPEGLFALHLIYAQGRPALGIKPDPAKASEYLSRAVTAGSPRALHLAGNASPISSVAIGYWERAAASGHLSAREALAHAYLAGRPDLPVSVEQGIRHLGLALTQALKSHDLGAADRLAGEIIRNKVWSQSQSLHASLMEAADLGSPQAAHAYALAATTASGKVIQPEAYAIYMGKAAGKRLAEAQFALGTAILQGQIPASLPSEGLAWIDKAAAQRHAKALADAIRYRIEDRSGPRDWPKIARCMQAAADSGLAVDWMKIPQRFRPEALQPKRPEAGAVPFSPYTKSDMDKLERISRFAGKRAAEDIGFMLKTFPAEIATDDQLELVGSALMESGNYKDAVVYLARLARMGGDRASYASDRLATFYDNTRPELAYEWRLIGQVSSFSRQRAIVMSRMKLTEKQKASALLSASLVMEAETLAMAATQAGVVLPAPKKAPGKGPAPDRDQLLKEAERLAADAEFSEEIELALAAYYGFLESFPDETLCLYDAASLAVRMPHGPLRRYWVLRAALAKQKPNLSNFEWCVDLARSFDSEKGAGLGLLDSAKWSVIARAEIDSARKRLPVLAIKGDKQARLDAAEVALVAAEASLASALARAEASVTVGDAAQTVRQRVEFYRAQAVAYGRH